jgi:hypothetical protein
VSSSSAFKSLLIFALALSVAWKIAIFFHVGPRQNYDLANFLRQNHFTIDETEKVVDGWPIVQATMASCRVQITRLAANGSDQARVRNSFDSDGRHSFVVFRGGVYPQQPVFWTSLDSLLSRHLQELGFVRDPAPVLAVAADSSCNAERLPWNELQ